MIGGTLGQYLGCNNVQLGGEDGTCLDSCPKGYYESTATVYVSFNSSDGSVHEIEGILEEVVYRTCEKCHPACKECLENFSENVDPAWDNSQSCASSSASYEAPRYPGQPQPLS